jgi:glycerophosphoryl diester phosphodiesterase
MELETRVATASATGTQREVHVPHLIAHRGYTRMYPENTLLSIHQALKAGACYVEFDVQFSAEGIPVLFHDANMLRTTGLKGKLLETPLNQLLATQAGEFSRFGRRFLGAGIVIPPLADAVYLLKNWPQAHAFVEIKTETLEKFGIEKAVKTLVNVIKPAIEQCVVISYDALAIRCARAMGAKRIGWVMQKWNDETLSMATGLAPDYLFCNYTKIPKSEKKLWRGPWKWALYDVEDPELALELASMGADLIETPDVVDMLQHPLLHQRGCFDGCQI